jgi:hypothetical protein
MSEQKKTDYKEMTHLCRSVVYYYTKDYQNALKEVDSALQIQPASAVSIALKNLYLLKMPRILELYSTPT